MLVNPTVTSSVSNLTVALAVPVTVAPVLVVSSFLLLSWYSSTEPSLFAIMLCSPYLPCILTSPVESPIIKSPVPFTIFELVPSCHICKSELPLLPSRNRTLSLNCKLPDVFVSAASLRLLELIQDKKINLVYIHPEEIMLSSTQRKLNRVAFNVFQEYTRSGLLNSMYLICNESVSSIIPAITIENFYDHINQAIANVFENVIFYLDQHPFLGAHHEPKNISRIRTVSYGDFDNNEKKNVFST